MFSQRRSQLTSLQQKRPRTANIRSELARIPPMIDVLDIEIEALVTDLGSDEFRDIPEINGEWCLLCVVFLNFLTF